MANTREEIREIYEVRQGLGSWATRLATEGAVTGQLTAIDVVHRQAAALSPQGLRPSLIEMNGGSTRR